MLGIEPDTLSPFIDLPEWFAVLEDYSLEQRDQYEALCWFSLGGRFGTIVRWEQLNFPS